MRRLATSMIVMLASCEHGGGGGLGDIDGRVEGGIDARQGSPVCAPGWVGASCIGGVATVKRMWAFQASSSSMCDQPQPADLTATCANGCAIEGEVAFSPAIWRSAPLRMWATQPSIFCAGAPPRMLGDACDPQIDNCLPTYAALASDGTVAGQTYLECGPSQTCAELAPPVISGYLEACDAALIAEHGAPDVSGAVLQPDHGDGIRACLLAWDSTAMTTRSGVSIFCLGDWMCPSGALCDDQISDLAMGGDATVAVCKPGPRGVIDPVTLSP